MNKTYSDLSRFTSFEDRLAYLQLDGLVGEDTFGHARHLNQRFYSSYEWKSARDYAVVRDNGCDLGVEGYEIHGKILVHHMTPITPDDIIHGESWIVDPEFLITTTIETHNAIHYGRKLVFPSVVIERTPGDTDLW